jgi:hypothetical protein
MSADKNGFQAFAVFLGFVMLTAFIMGCGQAGRAGTAKDQADSLYSTGSLEGAAGFYVLTPAELQIDSIQNANPLMKADFRKNRSRIWLEEFKDSSPAELDPLFGTGAPAACMGAVDRDTIFIKTSLGFFGGYVFLIKIYGNQFRFSYIPVMDEDVYKRSPADSAFARQISVMPRFQQLILRTRPGFEVGDSISGILQFTTADYFVKRAVGTTRNEVDTVYNSGKIFFDCVTDKKPESVKL